MLAEAADGLDLDGVRITGVVVPVTWGGAFDALRAAVHRTRPTALLMLGVADRPAFNFERVAQNRQGFRPDTEGALPAGHEVVPGGPAQLEARLPWSSLSTGSARAVCSRDAGDYLCNHLLYRALHGLDALEHCGFVHVPPLDSSGLASAMPWETLSAAGRSLIASLAATLAGPGRSAT